MKNRLGRVPLLYDFYENQEIDPLVIIREYKTYYAFMKDIIEYRTMEYYRRRYVEN
ncbi:MULTISPECIES: hypothetical protein [Clostridia]|uniref:hypothetical protein n=1 Tax=Clostridia TaxID=186801 RepID=UPI001D074EBB|nr:MULTISPECIES: hypothetical protein [Clostridia]MCB6547066.1 hypothetical protein [Blautia glucerasea]